MTLFILITIGIIALSIFLAHKTPGIDSPTTYRTDWKKPIELYYKDNVLTVTTLDHNIKEYYHAINEATEYEWYKHPSRKPITDNKLIKQLDKYYDMVVDGRSVRGGRVKSL